MGGNCISVVMVSMLTSSTVDHWFESLVKSNTIIYIFCFSAEQSTLLSKSKDWLNQNQV
jgi:hypothetical protein